MGVGTNDIFLPHHKCLFEMSLLNIIQHSWDPQLAKQPVEFHDEVHHTSWYHRRAKTDTQAAQEAASVMKQMQVAVELFIAGNEADHQLGRSIHPFDVVSWTKNGNDEELEDTLTLIAEVALSGEDLENDLKKELVKDLLSTRQYMLREVASGTDLLEAWIKTVHVFKNRLSKALPKVLYAVIAIWRGTGALEGWFHIGKPQNAKNCMTDEQRTARMRIRVNGPVLDEFCKKRVVQGKLQYEPGELCLLAQSLYASTHGTMLDSEGVRFVLSDVRLWMRPGYPIVLHPPCCHHIMLHNE